MPRDAMPELSPGALLLFVAAAANRRRRRCRRDDDGYRRCEFAASVVAFPADAAGAALAPLRFVTRHRHHRRVTRANDRAHEPPTDGGRPTVLCETLRGRAHGARLPVHILLHALPEFAHRQVNTLTPVLIYLLSYYNTRNVPE